MMTQRERKAYSRHLVLVAVAFVWTGVMVLMAAGHV